MGTERREVGSQVRVEITPFKGVFGGKLGRFPVFKSPWMLSATSGRTVAVDGPTILNDTPFEIGQDQEQHREQFDSKGRCYMIVPTPIGEPATICQSSKLFDN